MLGKANKVVGGTVRGTIKEIVCEGSVRKGLSLTDVVRRGEKRRDEK